MGRWDLDHEGDERRESEGEGMQGGRGAGEQGGKGTMVQGEWELGRWVSRLVEEGFLFFKKFYTTYSKIMIPSC